VSDSSGNPPGRGPGKPTNGKFDVEAPAEDEALDPEVPAASDEPSAIEDLQRRLQETEAKLQVAGSRGRDSQEKYLRAAADLENYRKRAMREREEVERFGNTAMLKELLPVMDNLDRALDHLSESEQNSALGQGVAATRRIFEDVLGKFGVKPFSAKGEVFDPNRHEAMQRVPTDAVAPGMVVQELMRGYTLQDRLIRPALVSVAVSKGGSAGEASEDPG
jgi:molecular chaperone GrpE